MVKKSGLNLLTTILTVVIICMMGMGAVAFVIEYIHTFQSGFAYNYSETLSYVSVSVICVITVTAISFLRTKHVFVYKLFLILISTAFIVSFILLGLKKTGFLQKVNSVQKLREYVESFGGKAVILFVLIQFLQVVFLPIPSVITVSAGVLLFGVYKGALFSVIGIVLGSFVAFIIGRTFGIKVVKWLFGEKQFEKGVNIIKGKDKIVLIFALLFPFFPDDLLCFIAGVIKMNPLFFFITVTITRAVSVLFSSISISNGVIPYNTWWGILLWVIFFFLVFILSLIIIKFGESIQEYINSKIRRKTKAK